MTDKEAFNLAMGYLIYIYRYGEDFEIRAEINSFYNKLYGTDIPEI